MFISSTEPLPTRLYVDFSAAASAAGGFFCFGHGFRCGANRCFIRFAGGQHAVSGKCADN